MLAQRLRRKTNIDPILGQPVVFFAGILHTVGIDSMRSNTVSSPFTVASGERIKKKTPLKRFISK